MLFNTAKSHNSKTGEPGAYAFPDLGCGVGGNGSERPPSKEGFQQMFSRLSRISGAGPGDCRDDEESEARRIQEAEKIKALQESAFSEGFQKGKQAGQAEGVRQIRPVVEGLERAFCEIHRLRGDLLGKVESEAVELALAIAKKVIHREVSVQRDVIVGILREALKSVPERKSIRIRMHPDSLRFLTECASEVLSTEGISFSDLEPDEGVPEGGCRIETDWGEIDARIEKQIQVLEDALMEGLQKIPHGGDA